MIPAPFEYIKASSVPHAIGLLSQYGYDAKVMSGGHSLIPAMKLRLNRPAVLIDIGSLEELRGIRLDGDTVVIGANTTHKEVATSAIIRSHIGILSDTAGVIGDVQIRNKGTIGGSLVHADPASDYPAAILATEAVMVVQGPDGERHIDAADFFQGIYTTALSDDEVLTSIRIKSGQRGVYKKFHQSASRFAVVGVAAVASHGSVRIGITGVADTPYRASAVEAAYDGTSAAAMHAVDGVDVMGDHFASAEYRAHLARVFVKRALEAL